MNPLEELVTKHKIVLSLESELDGDSWKTVATFDVSVFRDDREGNEVLTVSSIDDDFNNGLMTIFASLSYAISDESFRQNLLEKIA